MEYSCLTVDLVIQERLCPQRDSGLLSIHRYLSTKHARPIISGQWRSAILIHGAHRPATSQEISTGVGKALLMDVRLPLLVSPEFAESNRAIGSRAQLTTLASPGLRRKGDAVERSLFCSIAAYGLCLAARIPLSGSL